MIFENIYEFLSQKKQTNLVTLDKHYHFLIWRFRI